MSPNPRKPNPGFDPGSFHQDQLWQFLGSNIDADPVAGTFRLFDQRLLILRPEVLVDLQKQLEGTVGLSSKGFLYLAGEKSAREGHAWFDSFGAPPPETEDEPAVLSRAIGAIAFLGWGRFAVAPADLGAHRYLVTLENSPVAKAYGESKRPVCHILAGWVAGTAQRVLERSFLCEETVCAAQGKARCEFVLRPMPYP